MAEKDAQVRRMGEIYSKSSCALVWLGVQSHDAALINNIYNQFSTLRSNADNSGDGLMLDQ
jgi:hypothetical protein